MNARRRTRGEAGFSLIELLTVLLILAVVVAVAVPATSRFLDSIERKKKDEAIMASLRYARLMAISNGEPVIIKVADDSESLVFSGGLEETRSFPLDDGETISLDPETGLFYPEGFATPLTLNLSGGPRTVEIVVDPLTALPRIK